ncbi:MAG TPA: DNA gyrase inhibitor YacG [Pyrinomonadaceae bacterium]|jgi:hypothetical protein
MRKCPNCGKRAEWENNPARPFCSERCKLIDLGRWANEEYRMPATETAPPSESPETPQPSDSDA